MIAGNVNLHVLGPLLCPSPFSRAYRQ